MRSLHVFDATVAITLSIASLGCSGARPIEPGSAGGERRSAPSERDVVETSDGGRAAIDASSAPPTSTTPTLPSAIPEGTAIVIARAAGEPVPARPVDPQAIASGELIRETSPITPLRDGESVRVAERPLRRTFESEDWISVDTDRGSFAVAVGSLLTEANATRSPDRRWSVFVQCILQADICAHSVTVVGPRLERLDAVGAGGYPPYHVEAVWRADGTRVAISTYEVGPRSRLRVIEIPSRRVVTAVENVTGPVFTADGSLLARRDEDEAVVAITDAGEIRRVFGLRGTPPPVVDDGGEAAAYDPPPPVVLLEGGATLCANFRRGRRHIGVVATREGRVVRTGPECPSTP